MTILSTTTRAICSRLKAGLFTLVFLNVAVAPCAMAFDAERHCPNCPPELPEQMHGHHGHHGQQDEISDCASLKSQCGDLDQLNVDFRVGEVDVEPVPAVLDSRALLGTVDAPLKVHSPATGPPGWRPPGSPRLHEIFCVYRD